MNKLLKLSTALVLIGYSDYVAYSAAPVPSAVAPLTTASPAQPVVKTPIAPNRVYCDSVGVPEQGFAPVPGQSNTYQSAARGGGGCGVAPLPTPAGFVTTLPAGVKLLDRNNNPVVLTQPVKATYDGIVPISAPVTSHPTPVAPANLNQVTIGSTSPMASGYIPVPGQANTYQQATQYYWQSPPSGFITALPAGAKVLGQNNNSVAPVTLPPIPMPPSPTDPDSKLVEWMPAQYYRFTGPRGNKIYVDDNNGNTYVQLSNGTKTNLSPYPRGQYLMRPPKYQLPGWLLGKWTQNPADKGEYFVAADNGNSSNRIISKSSDGALQVQYITQNQRSGPNGIVHQVAPSNPVATSPVPAPSQPAPPIGIGANGYIPKNTSIYTPVVQVPPSNPVATSPPLKPQPPQPFSRAPSCYDPATGIHCG